MKSMSVVKYVFIVIGLGMMAGALFLFTNTQNFLKGALVADGTVTELVRSRSSDSDTYRPVVKFKTEDGSTIEFTSSAGSNPPSYSRGEVVRVLYHKATPERARIDGFFSLWGATTIVGGLGLVFLLVGLVIFFLGSSKRKKIEYLKKNGVPIKAKIQSTGINSAISINGRNPYQICAQWKNPATSEIHIFDSEYLWFDPTDHVSADEITVLIERDNPKKYYVDVSFLPKVAD